MSFVSGGSARLYTLSASIDGHIMAAAAVDNSPARPSNGRCQRPTDNKTTSLRDPITC